MLCGTGIFYECAIYEVLTGVYVRQYILCTSVPGNFGGTNLVAGAKNLARERYYGIGTKFY